MNIDKNEYIKTEIQPYINKIVPIQKKSIHRYYLKILILALPLIIILGILLYIYSILNLYNYNIPTIAFIIFIFIVAVQQINKPEFGSDEYSIFKTIIEKLFFYFNIKCDFSPYTCISIDLMRNIEYLNFNGFSIDCDYYIDGDDTDRNTTFQISQVTKSFSSGDNHPSNIYRSLLFILETNSKIKGFTEIILDYKKLKFLDALRGSVPDVINIYNTKLTPVTINNETFNKLFKISSTHPEYINKALGNNIFEFLIEINEKYKSRDIKLFYFDSKVVFFYLFDFNLFDFDISEISNDTHINNLFNDSKFIFDIIKRIQI